VPGVCPHQLECFGLLRTWRHALVTVPRKTRERTRGTGQIGKVLVEPSLKAAWEHEYKYSALPITAGFAGIPGPSATFFGPNEGHDSAVVSAGVSALLTPAISIYVNYDGQLGRGNYDSNAVTGGVRISF